MRSALAPSSTSASSPGARPSSAEGPSPTERQLPVRARAVAGRLLGLPDADRPRDAQAYLRRGLVADAGFAEADVEIEPLARAPDPAEQAGPRRHAGDPLVLDEDLAHRTKRVLERPLEDDPLEPVETQRAAGEPDPAVGVKHEPRPALRDDGVARRAEAVVAVHVREQGAE